MSGDWLKMEASTPDKPEVLAITVRMGWDDPDLTVGKLFRVWRWFDQQTVDGNARGVTPALLDRIAGVTGFAEAMQSVDWLEVTEDGIRLPGFEKHCGKTAKTRANTARRVAEHKQKRSGNGGTVTEALPPALPREEKRRDIDMSGKPDEALAILAYLNERTGKAFQPVDANLRLICARLREASPDDIRAVIDAKVAEWKGKPDMEPYLRPETLFGARKFAGYFGNLNGARPPGQQPVWAGAK